MVGSPITRIHYEAVTEDCICEKLPECGGIIGGVDARCPEHRGLIDFMKMHSHPVFDPPRIAVGTRRR